MSRFDGLDPWAILAHLGVEGVASVAPVEGGADTAIWRVTHEGRVSALRVFRAEQTEPARREAVVLAATAEAGIPGPTVRAAGTWQGRPVLLISWCAGRPLVEVVLSQPSLMRPLAFDFGRMQARIHAISLPPALGISPNGWIGYAGPGEAALQARLREMPHRKDVLLHGDYHPLNVLADGIGLTGVLDWVNVMPGDPRADLARTVLLLRLSDPPPSVPLSQFRSLRRSFEGWWRRGYESFAGPTGDLASFYAWTGAATLDDLADKTDRPGLTAQRARLRRWTSYWKRRAGIM